MIHHLQSTLERLEGLLDVAIETMSTHGQIDDASHSSAKGRALLALTRLSADIRSADLPAELRERIVRVRAKLTREQSLLKMRLEASEVVVSLIGEAVLAMHSDGTYGPRLPRPARGSAE